MLFLLSISFCFDITTTNEIYTLSLHDALPISDRRGDVPCLPGLPGRPAGLLPGRPAPAPARPDLAGGAVRAGRGDPPGGRDPAAADPARVPDRAEPQPGCGQAPHLPAPQRAGPVPLARRP